MSNARELRVEVLDHHYDFSALCLDAAPVGGRVRVAFASPADVGGPLLVRVRDPPGVAVFERLLRTVPMTPRPEAAVSVPVAGAGDYVIELRPVGAHARFGPRLDPWELETGGKRAAPLRADVVATALLRAA